MSSDRVNLLDFIPSSEWQAIFNGTSTYNATENIRDWLTSAIATEKKAYAPQGTYMMSRVRFDNFTVPTLYMEGDGRRVTRFKRLPDAHLLEGTSTIPRMFTFICLADNSQSFLFKGITFDGSDADQIAHDPEDLNAQQFSALIFVRGDVRVETVTMQDVGFEALTADGITIGGTGYFERLRFENVFSEGRTVRPRSDIVVTSSWDHMSASGLFLDSFEVEIDDEITDRAHQFFLDNFETRQRFDLNSKTVRTDLYASNAVIRGIINLFAINLSLSNFKIELDKELRLIFGKYRFNNGTIHATSDFDTSLGQGRVVTEYSGAASVADSLVMDNVDFSSDNTSITHFYYNQNNVGDFDEERRFTNCRFLTPEIQSAFFRRGTFTFLNCQHHYSGSEAAIEQLNIDGPGYSRRVRLVGNEMISQTTFLYQPPNSRDDDELPLDLVMMGNITAPGFLLEFNPNTMNNRDGTGDVFNINTIDEVESDGVPTTGFFVQGQRIKYREAVSGNWGAVCSVTGNADGTSPAATFVNFP
jgi:hypothetical protein